MKPTHLIDTDPIYEYATSSGMRKNVAAFLMCAEAFARMGRTLIDPNEPKTDRPKTGRRAAIEAQKARKNAEE